MIVIDKQEKRSKVKLTMTHNDQRRYVKGNFTVEAAVLLSFFFFVIILTIEGELWYYERICNQIDGYMIESETDVVGNFIKKTCYEDLLEEELGNGD